MEWPQLLQQKLYPLTYVSLAATLASDSGIFFLINSTEQAVLNESQDLMVETCKV